MINRKQLNTKKVYEDPVVVAGYLKDYKNNFNKKLAREFAKKLPGKRIIDIGCGPGHYSNYFASLGFETTGIDYSKEMIKKAKEEKRAKTNPTFEVCDMTLIESKFKKDSFDGAWANASLLHIPEIKIRRVLKGIYKIVKNKGKVFISLKKGKQGEVKVEEKKYGKVIKSNFIFWQKNNFVKMLNETGMTIEKFQEIREGLTGNKKTTWLRFFIEVNK